MDDASLAADLVRRAGTLAAGMLARGLETHYKTSISDVVSAADHAAEELVVSRLTAERPDDGLVGEEGADRPGARTWYIDPVDGTYNFLSGVPYWCSAVGLVVDNQPVLGAVYFPAVDQLWVGGRDLPTTLNGEALPTLTPRSLGTVSVATNLNPRQLSEAGPSPTWKAVVEQAAAIRVFGSASIDLSGAASGRVGIFLQCNLNPWDWVPGAALVLGAGGAAEIVEHDGDRWQLAGNPQAVAEAAATIRTGTRVP